MEKQILNNNIGVTNIIDEKAIKKTLITTFSNIREMLSTHLGPYSQFAMLIDPLGVKDPVFTKDGINILRSIEFISPMEEFARKTLAYIGSRIEGEVGDGTTSSMIITAAAMEYLVKNQKQLLPTTYIDLMNAYAEFVEAAKQQLRKSIYTIDTELEELKHKSESMTRSVVISKIAYRQAMASTHGDVEISTAVAKIFETTPEMAWPYIHFKRESRETSERIKIDAELCQYKCDCRMFMTEMYNDKLGCEYHETNCNLYIVPMLLMEAAMLYPKFMQVYEAALKDTDKASVFIMPAGTDIVVKNAISKAYFDHPNNKVAIIEVYATNPRINDITCITALSGNDPFIDQNNVLKLADNASVDQVTTQLELDNIYDNPTESFVHPGMDEKNTKYRALREMVKYMEESIAIATDKVSGKFIDDTVYSLFKICNKLKLTKRVIVAIGGLSYDNSATVDVIMDAIKAVKSSLLHGYMKEESGGILSCLSKVNRSTLSKNAKVIYDAFAYATACLKTALKSHNKSASTTTIYRPANIEPILLDRIGEVALKFVLTARLCAPGAVFLKKGD